jgi:hypothetical protein
MQLGVRLVYLARVSGENDRNVVIYKEIVAYSVGYLSATKQKVSVYPCRFVQFLSARDYRYAIQKSERHVV